MKARCLAPLFALLLCSIAIPTIVTGDEPNLVPRSHYNIHAQLDYPGGSITATEQVLFLNNTGEDLHSVVFNVTPAYYGAFQLRNTLVEGIPVTPTLTGVDLEVPLTSTLKDGQSARIDFDFLLSVPQRGGRLGASDGVIALGNWFPIANPYITGRLASVNRPPGWARHRYVEIGDAFFTEVADFDVALETTKPVVVAHSGKLVKQEGNSWTFRGANLRDFALAISSRYKTQTVVTNGLTVTVYYLPEDAAAGGEYLDAGSRMADWLSTTVLPYPYENLDIAEIHPFGSSVVGQEYPGLIFISSALSAQGGSNTSYLEYIVRHEVVHQWYYGIIGSDQVYDPWLDESMATWMAYDYFRGNVPDLFPSVWQRGIGSLLPAKATIRADRSIGGSIYDFSDEGQYFDFVYRRGAAFLEDVYQVMGRQAFYQAIRDYTATYRFEISTPGALFSFLQRYSPTDLRPIITDYFGRESAARLDGAIPINVEWPTSNTWTGIVQPVLSTTLPFSTSLAYVDDLLVGQSDSGHLPAIDTVKLGDREHLLTLKIVGQDGHSLEITRRFLVYNPATPTPTPSPEATSTATPVSVAAQPPAAEDSVLRTMGKFAIFGLLIVAIAAGRSLLRNQSLSPYPESQD